MEKTPKSRFFGLKSKTSNESRDKWLENTSENTSISNKDLKDLETLPVIDDVLKTPKRRSDVRLDFTNQSPQFRVGWDDDGCDSNFSNESPIYNPPVQRKFRRCPDELYNRVNKSSAQIVPQNTLKNSCDNWAKELFEISLEPISRIGTPTRNSQDDILDDSTDELLVLCSQAVEEEVKRSNDQICGNRSFAYENYHLKKQKLNESSESSKHKSNLRKGVNVSLPVESRVNKILQFDQNNVISTDETVAEEAAENVNESPEIVKKSDKLVDSMDLFKCVLDEDDEFISSIDFNYLDNLQKTHTQTCAPVTESTNACNQKPVVRYTEEQIEQRRLEAKRKRLLNQKHRSM